MLPDLKVEVPELEPPRVLLEQLAQLSQLSTSSTRSGGPGAMKALMATVSITVIAAVSWLTGTLPGVASPFSREPTHRPAPQHAPADPSPRAGSSEEVAAVTVRPPTVPPGQAKPARPHHDNGNHNGHTKPHQNNGNHNGQTKPHHNNGNHNGQTKPHHNNGNHNGQTKPHHNNGQGQGGGHGP